MEFHRVLGEGVEYESCAQRAPSREVLEIVSHGIIADDRSQLRDP